MIKKLIAIALITVAFFSLAACTGEDYYTVSFGGDYIEASNVTVKKDGFITQPEDPVKEGYVFLYWVDESGNEFDFSMPVDEDITLTAVWQKQEQKEEVKRYTVRFFDESGTQIGADQKIEEGKSAVAPAITPNDFFSIEWDADYSAVRSDLDVHAVQKYAAASDSLFTYAELDSSYAITGVADGAELPHMYNGYVKLALPLTHGGLPITAVADHAFEDKNIYSLYIPSCYKTIGKYAFAYNAPLVNVTFSEGLTSIGEGAFMASDRTNYVFGSAYAHPGAPVYISSLTKIELPSTLEVIGDMAFFQIGGVCENGQYVELPVSVDFDKCSHLSFIGDSAFEGVKLSSLVLPETEQRLHIGDFAFAADTYVNWVQTDFSIYPRSTLTSITLPSTIGYIGDYAFYGAGCMCNYVSGVVYRMFKPVTFKAARLSLDYIGEGAFMNSLLQGEVDITTTVIKDYTFFGQNLSSIKLHGVKSIGEYAFARTEGTNRLTVDLGTELENLGTGAFQNNIGLSAITLPDKLMFIGQSAFEGCLDLGGEVTVPSSVRSIGDWAFRLCNISSVRILGSVELGMQCFAQCASLKTILGNISNVGVGAFYECVSLTQVTLPSNMILLPLATFYNCIALENIELPAGLVEIGNSAFYGCRSLQSIVIPERTERIGINAFEYCLSLSSVEFGGERILEIKSETFAFCRSLEHIDLPDSVYSIGDYAFEGSGLTEFTTPKSLDTMGYGVFLQYTYPDSSGRAASLPVLEKFTIKAETGLIEFDERGTFYGASLHGFEVQEGNEHYNAVSGILYNADNTKLIMYVRNDALSNIELAEGLEVIEEGAFINSPSLVSVKLPDSLTTINKYAFYNCPNLRSIAFPSSLKTIGDYAFCGDGLRSIDFGSAPGVTTIGAYAFARNADLSSVKFPNSLETIGANAFYGCASLSNIDFSAAHSLKTIGSRAFSGDSISSAPKIERLDFSGTLLVDTGVYAFAYCGSLKEIDFAGIKKVEQGSFADCVGLVDLTLGARITSIESNAFNRCTSLASITVLPGSDLTSIMHYAFAGSVDKNTKFTTLDLSNATRLTTIGNYAFAYGDVRTVIMPDAQYKLGDDAFNRCANLSEVELGSVVEIGSNAFRYCFGLKEITLPASLRTVYKEAFRGLKLVTVNIGTPEDGNNISYFGESAFYDCTELRTVNIYGSNVPMLSGNDSNLAFHIALGNGDSKLNDNLTIFVDAGMMDAFLSDPQSGRGWSVYQDLIYERPDDDEVVNSPLQGIK